MHWVGAVFVGAPRRTLRNLIRVKLPAAVILQAVVSPRCAINRTAQSKVGLQLQLQLTMARRALLFSRFEHGFIHGPSTPSLDVTNGQCGTHKPSLINPQKVQRLGGGFGRSIPPPGVKMTPRKG